MSHPPTYLRPVRLLLTMGLALSCWVGCNKAAPPAAAPKPAAPAAAAAPKASGSPAADPTLAYVSVFEDLLPPKGKDPFFPKSHRLEPATPHESAAPGKTAPPVAILALKGIVGSASRRFAVINNEPMTVGETASVRVPDGRVQVQCLEIGSDYVLIKAEGENQTKRLEMGK
jgi:hypothetical protein